MGPWRRARSRNEKPGWVGKRGFVPVDEAWMAKRFRGKTACRKLYVLRGVAETKR